MGQLHLLGLFPDHHQQDESEHYTRQYEHLSIGQPPMSCERKPGHQAGQKHAKKNAA